MGSLNKSHQQGSANRPYVGNLPEPASDLVFATFRQQFPPCLLPQSLHHVQLLVEMFSTPANSGMRDLLQPLAAMTGVVDISSRTRNRPTAIYRFQTAHHSCQILGGG